MNEIDISDSSNSSWATSGVGSEESFEQSITGGPAGGTTTYTTIKLGEPNVGGGSCKRKRQRLTHLSQDEKLQRRKLKNRVAAQSARDRKKARMEDLEDRVKQLADQNAALMKENDVLKENMRKLLDENRKLLNKHKQVKQELVAVEAKASRLMEVAGSAASNSSVSLPKKQLPSSNKTHSQHQQQPLLLVLMLLSALTFAHSNNNNNNSCRQRSSSTRSALIKSLMRKLTLTNRRRMSVSMLKSVLKITYPT